MQNSYLNRNPQDSELDKLVHYVTSEAYGDNPTPQCSVALCGGSKDRQEHKLGISKWLRDQMMENTAQMMGDPTVSKRLGM